MGIEQNTEGWAQSDPSTSLCSPLPQSYNSPTPWTKCSISCWQRGLQSHLVS